MILQNIVNIGKGYIQLWVYDCQSPKWVGEIAGGFEAPMNLEQLCLGFKKQYMPLFHIHKPADIKINPYTK